MSRYIRCECRYKLLDQIRNGSVNWKQCDKCDGVVLESDLKIPLADVSNMPRLYSPKPDGEVK